MYIFGLLCSCVINAGHTAQGECRRLSVANLCLWSCSPVPPVTKPVLFSSGCGQWNGRRDMWLRRSLRPSHAGAQESGEGWFREVAVRAVGLLLPSQLGCHSRCLVPSRVCLPGLPWRTALGWKQDCAQHPSAHPEWDGGQLPERAAWVSPAGCPTSTTPQRQQVAGLFWRRQATPNHGSHVSGHSSGSFSTTPFKKAFHLFRTMRNQTTTVQNQAAGLVCVPAWPTLAWTKERACTGVGLWCFEERVLRSMVQKHTEVHLKVQLLLAP